MKDQWIERVSEYVDGELRDDERAAFESHLSACSECGEVLASVERVVAQARALEPIEPATDLWPAIAARITPEPSLERTVVRESGESRGLWGLRFTFSLPQLATAGAAIAVLAILVTWWMGNGSSQLGENTIMLSGSAPESAYAPTSAAFVEFSQEVSALKRLLVERGDELDPETVRVIEKNLKIIEEAIAQSRKALEEDPANSYVQEHLVATMGGKIKMLRRAADVALANSWESQM